MGMSPLTQGPLSLLGLSGSSWMNFQGLDIHHLWPCPEHKQLPYKISSGCERWVILCWSQKATKLNNESYWLWKFVCLGWTCSGGFVGCFCELGEGQDCRLDREGDGMTEEGTEKEVVRPECKFPGMQEMGKRTGSGQAVRGYKMWPFCWRGCVCVPLWGREVHTWLSWLIIINGLLSLRGLCRHGIVAKRLFISKVSKGQTFPLRFRHRVWGVSFHGKIYLVSLHWEELAAGRGLPCKWKE